jgi:hypothetical protein
MPAIALRPARWRALLLLLRVPRDLSRLHFLYQLLDPIKRSLIGNTGQQSAVMLDLAVEFDTFFTHCHAPCQAEATGRLLFYYSGDAILFQ